MPADTISLRLAAGLLVISVVAPATRLSAATVEVVVSGVVPSSGAVLASLCEGGLDAATCSRGQRRAAEGSTVTFVFPDVAPGRYAALAFQDVDGDGTLRRSRMGRPLDPYGLSNDAGRSRRPTFERAAVRVGPVGSRIDVQLERPGTP